MSISRRALLWRIGAGAAMSAGVPSLADACAVDGDTRDVRRGPVRLHQNECAAGPSDAVLTAIRDAASGAHRYPDIEIDALRERLSDLHAVDRSNIVVGNGSSEILRMATSAFVRPGQNVVLARPTFGLVAEAAARAGAVVRAVPLTSRYAHDLTAMLAHVDRDTGLVYVCNPNNPTGTLTGRGDLELFIHHLPSSTRIIIDEAYHHFAEAASEYASFIDRRLDDDRVIVTRTFSAIHGLAGLRVGYAVAAPDVVDRLASVRSTDGINAMAAIAARAAVDDSVHLRRLVQRNTDDRQEFLNQANARMLRAIDSQANFVMLNVDQDATPIVEHFRRNDVLVSGPYPSMPTYIRVSIGAPDEMAAFWRVWDLLPVHHMSM